VKSTTPVNWDEVYQAMRRCKYGKAQPGDTELCMSANKKDPLRYGKLHREMVEDVTREMRGGWS
jgi:hypothetical protein